MKQKGFTLIEILAVIVILGIVVALFAPKVNSIIKNASKELEKEQINQIINATKKYAVNNTNILPISGTTQITIQELINKGIIDNEKVINPKTKEELTGCVEITYNNNYNQYSYTYKTECE